MAVADAQQATLLNPSYPKGFSRLGMAYMKQGEYRLAVERGYSKALMLDPSNQHAQRELSHGLPSSVRYVPAERLTLSGCESFWNASTRPRIESGGPCGTPAHAQRAWRASGARRLADRRVRVSIASGCSEEVRQVSKRPFRHECHAL